MKFSEAKQLPSIIGSEDEEEKVPRSTNGKKEQVIVQVAEKILFRTFKDWLKNLLPVNFPRDKKGSPLLPKDAAGFQAVGKQIMDDHFSVLSENSCTDK